MKVQWRWEEVCAQWFWTIKSCHFWLKCAIFCGKITTELNLVRKARHLLVVWRAKCGSHILPRKCTDISDHMTSSSSGAAGTKKMSAWSKPSHPALHWEKESDTATSVLNASLIPGQTSFVAAATSQATCSLVKLKGGKSLSALLLHPIMQRSQSHFF